MKNDQEILWWLKNQRILYIYIYIYIMKLASDLPS